MSRPIGNKARSGMAMTSLLGEMKANFAVSGAGSRPSPIRAGAFVPTFADAPVPRLGR
jgi:hypothetical protein